MKIRFVQHASILVECKTQRILCDPWLSGKVFNNGWALVAPSSPPPFSDVDYIWISHEHPDHLHFPTLRNIADADKARIKVLYQEHASPRIVEALLKLGFSQVIELPLYKWFRLSRDFKVFCGSSGTMDSFIAFRDDQECILNLNDCVFNLDQLRYIKRCIGNITGLFTQFSFANWVGNDHDELHGAAKKIEQFTNQINIFKPEFTVPFASFVYFCNEENSRMNAWVNTPDTIANLNIKGVNFMYPGDEWNSDSRTFNSECALEKYRADYANITIDSTPDAVDISQISQAIDKCLREIKSKVPKSWLKKTRPFAIYIHDLEKVVEIDTLRGVHRVFEGDEQRCQAARYVMCSQVVWFTFAFSYGGGTTQISGMFLDRQFASGDNPFYSFFRIQNILSTEVWRFSGMKASLRTLKFWWRKKGEMLFRFTGKHRAQGVVDED